MRIKWNDERKAVSPIPGTLAGTSYLQNLRYRGRYLGKKKALKNDDEDGDGDGDNSDEYDDDGGEDDDDLGMKEGDANGGNDDDDGMKGTMMVITTEVMMTMLG